MKKTKAIVKVTTEFGKWCLFEIKGLKEWTVLEGMYNPVNNAFDFTWNGQDAMLWIGENGELFHKRGAKSWRNKLRDYIKNLNDDKRLKLTSPVNIMYKGFGDTVAHSVNIEWVGRYTKNGHCKLEDEVGQLFSLNDATEVECYNILQVLPSRLVLEGIHGFLRR